MKWSWLPRSRGLTPLLAAITWSPSKYAAWLRELREVFNRLQCALRSEQALDIDAAQRRRIDAVPELLRPLFADRVKSGVGVAVRVAIEARYARLGRTVCRSSV